MSCTRCNDDPCTCQRSLTIDKPKQQWLIQYCTTPGCEVAIRVKIEEPLTRPICKWCQSGTAYNTRPRPQINPPAETLLSLDDFGRDLFDAIRLQAAMKQAFKTAQRYRDTDKKQAAEESERTIVTLQKQLEAILHKNTIEPADLQRLLAIT